MNWGCVHAFDMDNPGKCGVIESEDGSAHRRLSSLGVWMAEFAALADRLDISMGSHVAGARDKAITDGFYTRG